MAGYATTFGAGRAVHRTRGRTGRTGLAPDRDGGRVDRTGRRRGGRRGEERRAASGERRARAEGAEPGGRECDCVSGGRRRWWTADGGRGRSTQAGQRRGAAGGGDGRSNMGGRVAGRVKAVSEHPRFTGAGPRWSGWWSGWRTGWRAGWCGTGLVCSLDASSSPQLPGPQRWNCTWPPHCNSHRRDQDHTPDAPVRTPEAAGRGRPPALPVLVLGGARSSVSPPPSPHAAAHHARLPRPSQQQSLVDT